MSDRLTSSWREDSSDMVSFGPMTDRLSMLRSESMIGLEKQQLVAVVVSRGCSNGNEVVEGTIE